MKLVLFCMNTEGSPHFASFKLARQLLYNDFRVVYVGFRFFEPLVLMQGLDYLAIDEEDAEQATQRFTKSFEATDKTIGRTFCRFMDSWLAGNKADLAIIDNIRLLDYSIPFHKFNIPVVGFGSNLSSSFSLQYPPVTSHLFHHFSARWTARLENLAAWAVLFLKDCPRNVADLLKVMVHVSRYGGSFQWGEYGYKLKVPNIIAMISEFDFPGIKWPKTDWHIGLSVDPERIEGRPLPLSLNRKKKLVYCSLGTHRYVKQKYVINFFNAVITAVLQRPHLQLVLHMRSEEQSMISTTANSDIIIADWVPQLEVLSRSYMFITHGGMGSVRESLYMGVPMIVFPLAVDQPGNAARVVYHHLGLRGDIRKVTSLSIGEMIDQVTNDPSFETAAKQMQQVCRAKEDDQAGVDIIRQILSGQKQYAGVA